MLNTSSNPLYQQVILADNLIEIIYEILFWTCSQGDKLHADRVGVIRNSMRECCLYLILMQFY